jgi:hypothetical protein
MPGHTGSRSRPAGKRRGPGRPPGGPGYGGRPRGLEMPCGWNCGARLTSSEIRSHFHTCPNRPEAKAQQEPR